MIIVVFLKMNVMSFFLVTNKKVNIHYLEEYNNSSAIIDAVLINEITNNKLKIIMLLLLHIRIVC